MANANEEKKKALDAAIAKLEKDFGKGAVMKLGDSGAHVNVETVPTGCLSLDLALGLGGVPKGRIIEVYGPESSGKTTDFDSVGRRFNSSRGCQFLFSPVAQLVER